MKVGTNACITPHLGEAIDVQGLDGFDRCTSAHWFLVASTPGPTSHSAGQRVPIEDRLRESQPNTGLPAGHGGGGAAQRQAALDALRARPRRAGDERHAAAGGQHAIERHDVRRARAAAAATSHAASGARLPRAWPRLQAVCVLVPCALVA